VLARPSDGLGATGAWRGVETDGTCGKPVSDQVIRENPASRGTETSAEVLVGPPWRMVSNAGQQQWYEVTLTLDGVVSE
jgi:hypothetical protein